MTLQYHVTGKDLNYSSSIETRFISEEWINLLQKAWSWCTVQRMQYLNQNHAYCVRKREVLLYIKLQTFNMWFPSWHQTVHVHLATGHWEKVLQSLTFLKQTCSGTEYAARNSIPAKVIRSLLTKLNHSVCQLKGGKHYVETVTHIKGTLNTSHAVFFVA